MIKPLPSICQNSTKMHIRDRSLDSEFDGQHTESKFLDGGQSSIFETYGNTNRLNPGTLLGRNRNSQVSSIKNQTILTRLEKHDRPSA